MSDTALDNNVHTHVFMYLVYDLYATIRTEKTAQKTGSGARGGDILLSLGRFWPKPVRSNFEQLDYVQ